jgi:ABC-2 type transport system permease protein
MSSLVKAELLKLRTVSLPMWLLLVTLALVVLSVVATILTAGVEGAPLQRDDPQLLAIALASASAGNIPVLVLGILALTQEFRFGTATPSFLVTPKRGLVLLAKLIAMSLTGLVFAVVSTVVALVVALSLLALRDDPITWGSNIVEVLLGVGLVMLLYGPIGVAVGALIRNQIAAVVAALAWTFIAEQLLVALLPEVGRWTPGGAANAVLQLGEVATTRGELLPVWGGALLLVAYALVLAAIGARLTLRRDLT